MTFTEYIHKVREAFIRAVQGNPDCCRVIGLCLANDEVHRKLGNSTNHHYRRLKTRIDVELGHRVFLTSIWRTQGRYGVSWRPRDTMRKYSQRLVAARLQFLHNLMD